MSPVSYQAPQLLINGEWRRGGSGKTMTVVNPADGQPLDTLGLASEQDLQDVLAAADRGFHAWRIVPAHERCARLERGVALMRERSEHIAHLLTLEQGKPLAEARMECALAADLIKWYAEEARRTYGRIIPARAAGSRMDVLKAPVGPVAAFSPWNFPLVLSARKLGGALAAGCSIVLKAAEETPASVAAMVECLAQELPAGTLQLVYGVPSEVSKALIASPVIRKITFTGSVPVGRHLAQMAGEHLKPITLELGGHAPVIVCGDADLDRAVPLLVGHKYRNAGQACLAPTRFFVARRLYGDFLDAFAAGARKLHVGNGMDEASQMGPVASARRQAAVLDLVDRTVAQGALLLAGEKPDSGFFLPPMVLAGVDDLAPAMQEEPFGPVACVTPFDTLEEATGRANANSYGLAGYLFTDSARSIHAVSQGLEVGCLAVNGIGVSMPEAPFGGVKDSGYGSESGTEGMDAFIDSKFLHYTT